MSRATRTSFGPRATSHELQRSSSRLVARCSQLLLALLSSAGLSAQRSPFNNLEVLPADSTGHYRILIGGHFHGESTNRSGYPAATLLANLDTINRLGANLFLSTGDLFMDPVGDMPRYQRSLFSELKMPFFNAPGNHDGRIRRKSDLSLPAVPVMQPGDLFYGGIGCELFPIPESTQQVIFLDTEENDGSITAEQLNALEEVGRSVDDVVFIISHRPIWSEDDPQYSPLFEGNTRSLTGTNFQKDVYPLLEKIAEHAHVYWISGSLGGSAPSSIFFQEHAKNITYIQCAIRDEPRDALLIADVHPDTVKWSSFSLTGQKLLAPEAYNAAWWREHIADRPPFNWRMLPYLVKTTVLRKEFWWGVLGGVLVLMLIRRFYRR